VRREEPLRARNLLMGESLIELQVMEQSCVLVIKRREASSHPLLRVQLTTSSFFLGWQSVQVSFRAARTFLPVHLSGGKQGNFLIHRRALRTDLVLLEY
jgi:hypothetical protein